MIDRLWVVGDTAAETPDGQVWFIKGVFSTKEQALAACTTDHDFLGELTLDEITSEKRESWPGAYYPLAGEPK